MTCLRLCCLRLTLQHGSDNPSNPRNPYRLIGRINTTIDTALTQADDLLVLVRSPLMLL